MNPNMDSLVLVQPASILFLFLLALLCWLSVLVRSLRKLSYPPGPKGLPIIGNMNMMEHLTHRGLAKLSDRYGGLTHLRLGFLHIVTISTPEMARQVLQVHDAVFSNRAINIAMKYLSYDQADMAFAHYGPFWRQTRRLCVTKLFSRRRIESWKSVRDEVASMVRTVASTKAGESLNVGKHAFQLATNITYRAAFGSDILSAQEKFVSIVQEFSRLFAAFNLADFIPWLSWIDPQGLNPRLVKARNSLDVFIDTIIDTHIAKRKNRTRFDDSDDVDTDMVDDLLDFYGEGRGESDDFHLTRDNIKAIIMDVMFGGTETVGSAIEWVMAELMKNPEDLERVQQELEDVVGLDRCLQEEDLEKLNFFKCTVKETLRLHPAIPVLIHATAKDVEVGGYFIPKGTHALVNVWQIARDKNAWDEPLKFNPSRFLREGAPDFKGNSFGFLPFGSGRRSCPGLQLGLYTLELAVANLLHCFNWDLPDGMKPSELDMSDAPGFTTPKAVHLVAVPSLRLKVPLN